MNKLLKNKENTKILLTVFNMLVFVVLFLIALYFFYPGASYRLNGFIIISLIYIVFIVVFGKLFEIFELGETRVNDLFLSYSLTLFVTNFLIYFIVCLIAYSRLPVMYMLFLQIIDMLSAAFILLNENKLIRDNYPIPKAIAIFGEPNYEILEKIYKYRDILVTVDKKVDIKDINIRKLDELLEGYERVITVDVNHEYKKRIFKACYSKKIHVLDIPSISDMLIASSDIMHVIDTPILKINKFGPNALESSIKRLIDVACSLILIVLTSPIMLLVAIAIKINDGGNILYKQSRLTKDEKVFQIYKFRSMIMNAEKSTGAVLASENDNRITKVGRFIRKTRFDELPQLFNILKGDMTFVGPRPERPEIYSEIIKKMPEFKYRLVVKAGLTGYAQIYGKYNTTMRDKLLFDIFYIEHYSLIDDIKLLIETVKMVFKPESTEGVDNK